MAPDGSLIVEEVEGEQVRQVEGDNLEQVAQIDLNVGVENVQVEDQAGGTGPDWDMVDSPLSEDNDFDVNMSFLGEEEIDRTIHSVSQSILSDMPPPPQKIHQHPFQNKQQQFLNHPLHQKINILNHWQSPNQLKISQGCCQYHQSPESPILPVVSPLLLQPRSKAFLIRWRTWRDHFRLLLRLFLTSKL